MFLDTNIIIGYLDSSLELEALEIIGKICLDDEANISGIVLAEVLSFQNYTDKQASDVELFIKNNFIIHSVDESVLLLASKIARSRKRKTNKKLKLTDAIISATAILNNKSLYTLDKDDFKDVDNLILYKSGT